MPDILLVEDKESLRRVLRLTLENSGYSVTEAADARAAVREIERLPHRMVLTDLRMGDMDGLALVRAIHATRPETGEFQRHKSGACRAE